MFSYWFATYTWDLLNYLVPALGILILFAAFQVDSYKDELGIVFLMLVSHHLVKPCFVSYLGIRLLAFCFSLEISAGIMRRNYLA